MDLGTLEKEVLNAGREAVRKAIAEAMTGYNSPLSKAVHSTLAKHEPEFAQMIEEELVRAISDGMRDDIRASIRTKLASVIVSKVGGEIERRVNELRQNPEARAKMTLALTRLVDEIGGK